MLAVLVIRVVGVELAQVLDAVHELRHARGDVVVAVEADGAVCYGLGPVLALIQQAWFTARAGGTYVWVSGRLTTTWYLDRRSCNCKKSQGLAANPPTSQTDLTVPPDASI